MSKTFNLRAVFSAKDGLTKHLKNVGIAFAAIGAAALAASVVIVKALGKAVEAAKIQEDAEVALAQAIRNSGQAVEDTLPSILKMASAYQDLTGVGDEVILQGQALLVTMGKLSGEGLEKATQAALDMGAATGNLEGAFDLVAKASVGYTSTLSRYGIILDESTPATEKFGAALEKIDELFGGQATARMKTYSGRLEAMAGRWGDFKEKIGDAIIKSRTINALIAEIDKKILGLSDSLDDIDAEEAIQSVVIGLGVLSKSIISAGTVAVNAALSYKALWEAIGPKFGNPFEVIDGEVVKKADTALQDTLNAIQANHNAAERLKEQIDLFVDGVITAAESTEVLKDNLETVPPIVEEAAVEAEALKEEMQEVVDVAVLLPVSMEYAVKQMIANGRVAVQYMARDIDKLGVTIKRNLRGVGVSSALAFGDALVDAAIHGGVSFKEFFKQVLADLAKAIVQALILRAILSFAPGLLPGFSQGGVVGSVGIPLGMGGVIGANRGLIVPGIDTGFDKVPVIARPGEAVLPPELTNFLLEASAGGGGGGGDVYVTIEGDMAAFAEAMTTHVRRGFVRLEATALAGA